MAVIVTGPLAGIRMPNGTTLGPRFASQIWGNQTDATVVIEDADYDSAAIVAKGAATFSYRLAQGLPTYKDTLPRLRTSIYLNGVPAWFDLTTASQMYVDGGKVWRRSEPISGLEVQEGRRQLQVTIHHEEYPTVRQVIANFPQPSNRRTSLELEVAVEPAQGNAQVEVISSDPAMFGQRKVFLNWREMADLEKTPDVWLKTLPTLFPQLLKRDCSPEAFMYAEHALQEYLDHPTPKRLKKAILRLQFRDNTAFVSENDTYSFENSRTAISSDGTPPRRSAILDRFVEQLKEKMVLSYPNVNPDVIRALAYTSTDDTDLQDYLYKRIQIAQTSLPQHELNAIGRCLRNPLFIAKFAQIFRARCALGLVGTRDWIKALGEVLRFRLDATHLIPSPDCEQVMTSILRIFMREYDDGNLKFNFRYSCLCIAYLLRRRAYDDEFINPKGNLARRVKQSFGGAARDLQTGRLRGLGGAINLVTVLHTVIAYIDRQGPSILSAGSEFRGIEDREENQ